MRQCVALNKKFDLTITDLIEEEICQTVHIVEGILRPL